MSNPKRFSKTVRKARHRVQEMEEVETVDRRGKVRVKMQPVKQKSPATKGTPTRGPKRPRWNSPSPMKSPLASESVHPIQKLKATKVCDDIASLHITEL
jgi:hypothetical protein